MQLRLISLIFLALLQTQAFALSLGDNSITPTTPLCSDRLAVGRVGDTTAKRSTICALDIHGADIASASTVNLTTATGQLVDVTGTTTITAITLAEGQERTVRFTGALTLTHGASLVLPGATNITTAAGDFAVFRGYGSSVVRMVNFQPSAGVHVSSANKLSAFAATTSAELAGIISNETGSGALCFATSPTFTTPLVTVGSGATTIQPSGSLFLNVTPVSNVGAGEDTLQTNTIGASTLTTTGQYIEWEVAGTNANNVNSKVIKLYFGGTLVGTITQPASVAGGWWKAKVTVTRTGSSAQTWVTEIMRITTGGGTVAANTSGSTTETETNAIVLRATGEAVSDNDITQTKSIAKNFGG